VNVRAGRALTVLAAHLDDDEWIDVFVTNDLNPDSLFLNEGHGRFRDHSELSGTAYDYVGRVMSSMGVDAADTTGTGRLNLLVTHFQDEYNLLFVNHGGGLFQDLSELNGTGAPSLPFVGWGILFSDFDLDGWSDALVTNGHVDDNRQQVGESVSLTQQPLLYHNRQGKFAVLGAVAGPYFVQPHQGRGLTVADLDNDGDEDAVFNHRDEPAALLRNDRAYPQSGSRRSVVLRLIGTRSNRGAVGAVIRLHAGARTKVEQIKGGGGYQSARDPRLVFAVSTAENELRFEIDWPSGLQTTLSDLRPGGSYAIVEPADGTMPPGVFLEEVP
jgi:hypothetical protein